MQLHQFTQIDPEVGAAILKTHGLTFKERETVKLLFGLGDGFCYSYEQIAELFNVTLDQVRELEANAAEKLKDVVIDPNS